jgi:hypothetical protein
MELRRVLDTYCDSNASIHRLQIGDSSFAVR